MEQLLAALLTFFTSLTDVPAAEALLSTAKDTRLTLDTAAQNIAAARFAGALTGIDADLLLSIAHHESRFDPTVVGPLVRGKRACGVMQQVPIKGPCPEPSLLRDYIDGAQHLAGWLRAQRGDLDRALVGYAGGYRLLKLYDEGGGDRVRGVVRLERARAARIKRARERAAGVDRSPPQNGV
jgi:transglycosylase-like protein with SLT domain